MEIKPAAMALPQGTSTLPQGKYGPIFPKTPACYGFSVIAKVKPGWEEHPYKNAKVMEKVVADNPEVLAITYEHTRSRSKKENQE